MGEFCPRLALKVGYFCAGRKLIGKLINDMRVLRRAFSTFDPLFHRLDTQIPAPFAATHPRGGPSAHPVLARRHRHR
jgi:hypothetical protein